MVLVLVEFEVLEVFLEGVADDHLVIQNLLQLHIKAKSVPLPIVKLLTIGATFG